MTETRDQLLGAAVRCIADKGLAGTTSRAIAKEAGVNLAAITYHFGSKDQLVTEAMLEALRSWLEPTLAVLGSGRDPSERTLLAIQTLVQSFKEHVHAAPVFLQALVEAPRMESLQDGVIGLWGDLRRLLAAQMSEMKRDSELARWVDPEAMSSVLVAVANGLVLQVVVDPEGPSIEAMASQFGALLLAARPDPSSAGPARADLQVETGPP